MATSTKSLRVTQILDRFRILKPYKVQLTFGYLLLLLTAGFQLFYPSAVSFFIDRTVSGAHIALIAWAGAGMTLVLLVHAAAIAIRHYLFAAVGSRAVMDLRNNFFAAVTRQNGAFFDDEHVGALSNRLSVDIQQLQEALTVDSANIIQATIIGVGGAVMLVTISPSMSLLIFLIAPLLVLAMRWVGRRARRLSKIKQAQLARSTQIAQEVFSNMRLVHAFTQEETEKRRFRGSTASALRVSLSVERLFASLEGGTTFVQSLALLITVIVGGMMVAQHHLTIGQFTKFLLYAGMAAGSASSFSSMWGVWMRVLGATDRVFEIISTPAPNPPTSTKKARLDGEIRFENVEFRYPTRPEHPALKHFSLTIRPGEKIALVGASGAGKSTIVNLLLGFYRPTAGRIMLSGTDMAELDIADVRRHMAIVEQEPALFSTSILGNIRYGSLSASVDTQSILDAARHAYVHGFTTDFPNGYQTRVGARGMQLSGGQKQRVAIARALIRDPELLILDEATSALDAHSESMVQEALGHIMKGRTTIIIAHRLSTIAFADRVVVLREGEVVQCGTHRELMNCLDGYYHQLVSRQLHGHNALFDAATTVMAMTEKEPSAVGPQSG